MKASDVTVLIGTFGDPSWQTRALAAAASAERLGCRVVRSHAETLAKARTLALRCAHTPWVVHLDADDTLGLHYFTGTNDADVQPTRICYGVRNTHRARYPQVAGHAHQCDPDCLREGNYIHIGAIMRTDLARELTWHEHEIYEDWCWWVQAMKAGAWFVNAPGIYQASVRRDSRNRAPSRAVKQKVHYEIATEQFPEKDWSFLLS